MKLSPKMILNDYSDDTAESEVDLAVLQNSLIVCLKEVVEACEKHGIKPFLQGGNLLGYIRSNGFIPWDDDLDLGMSRKDYNTFIEVFEEILGDKYDIHGPHTGFASNRFIQIYRKGTILKTKNSYSHTPERLYIDIFPIDYAPNSSIIRTIKGYYCNFLMIIASAVSIYRNKDEKRYQQKPLKAKLFIKIYRVFGMFFSFRKENKWFDVVDRSIAGKKKTQYCTSATGRKHYLGEVVNAEVFFPVSKVDFLNTYIYIPNKPKEYLKNLYGSDFLQEPPIEKRERHFITYFDPGNLLENTSNEY